MLLQAEASRTRSMEPQEAAFYPGLKVDADGTHVAQDFLDRLFGSHVQGAFASPACGLHKMSGNAALAGACAAGDQDAHPPREAFSAQHRVQTRDARRDSLQRSLVVQLQGTQWQHRNAILPNQERIFARAMNGAAVFHDAQATNRIL